jgi:hypothetical protein
MTRKGAQIPKTTTSGWKLVCQWRGGSSNWIDFKHIKDSNPIELAKYAVANSIQEEPAFKWWDSETLQTRNRIIGKVKCRCWKTSNKFGVRLPQSLQEALQFERELRTNFWWKAIQKETGKAENALEYDETVLPDTTNPCKLDSKE